MIVGRRRPGPFRASGSPARRGAARARGARRWSRGPTRGAVAARCARAAARPPASRCATREGGATLLDACATLVKSPGVPREAPVVAAARERGHHGDRRARARRGGCSPNEFIAVTGSNGKTTTVELIGHIHREAGLPVAVAGNVGTALASLPGTLDAGRGRRLRGVVVPARGHAGVRARGRGAAQPRRGPPGPPRHLRGLPRRQAAGLRPPAAGRRSPSCPRGARRSRTLGGARRARVTLRRRRRRRTWRDRDGAAVVARRAADGRRRDPPARRRTTARTRWPPPRSASPAASTPEAVRAGLATFAGVAHRLEEVADASAACLRQRLQGDQRRLGARSASASFAGGVHLIAGGSGKGSDFAPLARAGRASAAPPCT